MRAALSHQTQITMAHGWVAIADRLTVPLTASACFSPAPTKKSVFVETVEVTKLRRIDLQSHVYAFRLTAFHRASLLPNSGSFAR
jgi:hypothetical protein